MKMFWIAVVCALCVAASVGCGSKEAEDSPAAGQEDAPKEKTGNVVVDNIESEPMP